MKFALAQCAGVLALGCCTISHACAQEQAVDTAGSDRRVDILNYRVEGNSVLPRVAVEEALMPYLGPQRPIADVEAARAALEKAYRDQGYQAVSVQLPEQDVKGGVFLLNVTEYKVGRLRVKDARYFSPEDIRKRVPALAEGEVPNYRAVSQQMAALNKSGERTIAPVLRAGDTPNTVDVDLEVEDKLPLHGSFELNDRNSSRTERIRAAASLRYSNLFQLGHSISLQGQVTPTDPSQSWVVSGSYVAPIADTGLSLLGYAVHSHSDVAAIGGIGVLGSGNVFGLRALYSFLSGETQSPTVHQLTVGFDYKDFEENLILGADRARTPIQYVPATVQYSMSQRTERYDFDLSLAVNAGIRGLGADAFEFGLKRYRASPSFLSVRTDISYLHRFAQDWCASVKLSGQLADGPLISNEQFAAGGLDSVRGYYESQELGDDGLSMQVQVDSPSLSKGAPYIDEFRVFAFADGGYLHIRYPLSSQAESTRLLSVGGGITFRAFNYFNASTLLAAPLRQRSSVPTDIGDSLRLQMRLWTEF